MVETASVMMPLGTKAPNFQLVDTVGGGAVSLSAVKGGKGALLMFICNHCPFVKHIENGLAQLGKDYAGSGIGIAAINANDAARYPDDAPDKMKETAKRCGYSFPYVFDETQSVARAYGAVCTPDIFLFDGELKCAYRGQFDGSRPGNNIPVTGGDLRAAMDLLIAGKPVPAEGQKPSVGCSIKWK